MCCFARRRVQQTFVTPCSLTGTAAGLNYRRTHKDTPRRRDTVDGEQHEAALLWRGIGVESCARGTPHLEVVRQPCGNLPDSLELVGCTHAAVRCTAAGVWIQHTTPGVL